MSSTPGTQPLKSSALSFVPDNDELVTIPSALLRQLAEALQFYGHGLNRERVVLNRPDTDVRLAPLQSNPTWVEDKSVGTDVVLYREDGSRAREATMALAERLGDRYQAILDSGVLQVS